MCRTGSLVPGVCGFVSFHTRVNLSGRFVLVLIHVLDWLYLAGSEWARCALSCPQVGISCLRVCKVVCSSRCRRAYVMHWQPSELVAASVTHGAMECCCPDSYLVDPASSHMLVSKTKPCMSKYKCFYTVKLRMAH